VTLSRASTALEPESPPARNGRRKRAALMAVAFAGPVLIVTSVLIVLHDFAFSGRVTFAQADVAALWIPAHCFLGTTLAHGHIPDWNPYVFGGIPFAADPQSGWMYLPPMLLYTLLPCATAARWFIVLQPLLAGLGIYWFLRSEDASRTASTVGGLALGMAIAGSRLAVDLPFAGSLAWAALLLAASSRCLRARTWPGRLGWVALTAICWGQIAAAHLSHGLVIGTLVFVAYVAGRTIADLREGRTATRERLLLLCALLFALPLVNLAYFLPRLAYLPTTTLGAGYAKLQEFADGITGRPILPYGPGPTATPTWPLAFATSPGPYLGAAALALSFAGWWSRRARPLVIAFSALGALCYVATLGAVARAIAPAMRVIPLGDFYLQSPFRFRYALPLILAVLAGLGVDAWLGSSSWRERAQMLVPGLLVWVALPPIFGAHPHRIAILGVGAVAGAIAFALAARRPTLGLLIPCVLAIELVAGGLLGLRAGADLQENGITDPYAARPLTPMGAPTIVLDRFFDGGPFLDAIRSGADVRFVSLNPRYGYLGYLRPREWPYLTNQRSMFFDIQDAQGYNSIEPLRFWEYVRAATHTAGRYNTAVFSHPSPAVLDLMQIGWAVTPDDHPPGDGYTLETTDGEWTLYRRDVVGARASAVGSWRVAGSPQAALAAVTAPGFDPSAEVILEEEPSPGINLPPTPTTSQATYHSLGPDRARIDVRASHPSIVLIRNTYDPNWHATVDGRPALVLRADYAFQAVRVFPGTHTIVLTYDDPWIGIGLVGSALAIGLLLGAALVIRRLTSVVA
jgi:hypothetical protein